MDKEQIHKILKDKTRKIVTLIEYISPGFDHDTIHKLRVEIKKLRAFLRLMNAGSEGPEIKIPKKFKRLYHIVGAIRDAQLEQKKIAAWHTTLPLYSDNLAKLIHRQKEEWEKHYSKKILVRFQQKIDDHAITALHPHMLKDYFNTRLENIDEISRRKVHSNNQVHTIRKQVKDMLYNAKFAKKNWKEGFEEIAAMPLKELDALSTVIGDYNDARIMLEHLSSFSSATMTAAEKDAIAAICTEEMDRQQTEKKKVLARIKQFVKAAQ